MTGNRLTELVTEGARRALAAFRHARPGEHLAGFALCTDDDLRSLSAVGCTRAYLAGQDPGLLFQPTEWPDDGDDLFDEARRVMWAAADAADEATFGHHVERAFRCLVAALGQLRSEGAVGDDVFLVALSTDPGERLTELADTAVRDLNPAEFHRRWRRVAADVD